MHIVFLSTLGPDTPDHMRKFREAGYELTRVESVEQAERLLETNNGDVLVYTWPYEDKLKWIKKRFITICQDPRVTFDKFLEDLKSLGK